MSKKEVSYKSKQPKIKNIFIYIYCCISKILAILWFGIGAVVLAILVFPFIRHFLLLYAGKTKIRPSRVPNTSPSVKGKLRLRR